jgi:hypothetical protein
MGYFHDDAFVTYQYARNIAQGHGMVFNAGERVLGTSTPLYTLVLAAFYPLAQDNLPVLSIYISCFSIVLAGLLMGWILFSIDAKAIGVFVGFLIGLGTGGGHSYIGLETNFLTALLPACFLLALKKRYTYASILMSLCILTRYDTVLFVGLLWGLICIKEKRLLWRSALLTVIIPALWFSFSLYYYGTVFPATFYAKKGVMPLHDYLSSAPFYLEENFLSSIRHVIQITDFKFMLFKYLFLACFFYGAYRLYRKNSLFLLFAVWPVAHVLGYGLIGPPAGHAWHLYPIMPFLIAGFFVGLFDLLKRLLTPRRAVIPAIVAKIYPLVALCIALHFLFGSFFAMRENVMGYTDSFWIGQRCKQYSEVGEWLALNTPPEASVLAGEVGMIGFLAGHRMIDRAGLITPGVSVKCPVEEVARKYDPDYIVLLVKNVSDNNRKFEGYKVVKEFRSANFYPVKLYARG